MALPNANRDAIICEIRAEHDDRVNLNAKLDPLLTHQWQQLLEIQRVQADLIQDAMCKRDGKQIK